MHQDTLATKRTLWFLGQPLADAGPAKDVAACGGGGALHGLETEGAFPLLGRRADVGEDGVVFEVYLLVVLGGRVEDLGEVDVFVR